jgi:enoyl-CoA hydratase/carnithine racemase
MTDDVAALPWLADCESLHPKFDSARGALWLWLDHGKANEMGTRELDAFAALAGGIERDARVRVLCTSSSRTSAKGSALFISGANVTERTDWDDARIKAHVLRQRELMVRLRRLPVFHVVLTHGVTLGWGAEYLLTADYVLATPEARIGLPETGLGILPGARGTAELAALVGPAQALRLGMTGEAVPGAEAVRIGLAQELVADLAAGEARVAALAELVALRSPTALAAYKAAVLDGLGRPEPERLALEAAAYERCVDGGDAAIGRAHFDAIRQGHALPWGPRVRE